MNLTHMQFLSGWVNCTVFSSMHNGKELNSSRSFIGLRVRLSYDKLHYILIMWKKGANFLGAGFITSWWRFWAYGMEPVLWLNFFFFRLSLYLADFSWHSKPQNILVLRFYLCSETNIEKSNNLPSTFYSHKRYHTATPNLECGQLSVLEDYAWLDLPH